MKFRVIARAAALLVCAATSLAQASTITANNPGGDAYTNATTVNMGQALGASGWYYNNVRNNGVVGVDGTYARDGAGSVHLQGLNPNGAVSSKGDIEYLANAVANPISGNYAATGSLGALSALSEMHYDWYRNSSSASDMHLHPSMRVFIDRDGDLNTAGDRAYLIFETVYNGGSTSTAVATNTWVSQSIIDSTFLWSSNGYPDPNGGANIYDSTLADWKLALPNAVIMGFSSGFGSGWSQFDGAVDNIGWTIGGATANSNFEALRVDLPEPASLALVGIALGGMALSRRRKA